MLRPGPTFFDRLRRATLPRVLLLVAALLASQGSMACAFEGLLASADSDTVLVALEGNAAEDCCNLCLDCAGCGGCHGFTAGLREAGAQSTLRSLSYVPFSFDTSAPPLWAPPALLRPPIVAA